MKKTVREYYEKKETRWGFKLFLHGAQHFGFYPLDENKKISEWDAQKIHHDEIVRQLKVNENDKVLDIGCGRGIVARDLAQRKKLNITGIDLTPYIVEEAKANCSILDNPPNFINGSYQDLPFRDSSFDGLYAIETLSHATDLRKALSEAFRVVKPGHRCVFFEYQINDSVKITEYERKIYELVRDGSAMNSLDLFKGNGFEEMIKDVGFKDVRTIDISRQAGPSFRRLYQYARIPYLLIKLLNLQKHFINATAAVEYFKLAQKRYLNYWIYSAVVPQSK